MMAVRPHGTSTARPASSWRRWRSRTTTTARRTRGRSSRMKITVEQVLNSVMVADPLHILDCSPITDGAAAVILCPADMAKKLARSRGVKIIGIGHATDTIALHDRDGPDRASTRSAKAAEQAYKMAGQEARRTSTSARCTTASPSPRSCVTEALGFFEKGKGGPAVEAGETAHRRQDPDQPQRRPQVQGPSGRRDRRRPDRRGRRAAARRGGRAAGQGRHAWA